MTSLSFIGVFTPAVALLLGLVFLGERPTKLTAVGAVLILAGVSLAVTGAAGPPETSPSGPALRTAKST